MKNLFFLATAIALLTACSTKKQKSDFSQKADSLLNIELNVGGPGGVVLVVKDDRIVYEKNVGEADLHTHVRIDGNTLFNLGSISKTFVAHGILILKEEGKLSLEDSLIKYFPDFKNKEIGRKVKIKHLLTHSSGLPDNRHVNDDTVFYLTAKDAENWAPELKVKRLEFEPGTAYRYSNPAFNGLALIIEKVSGQKWQDFIAERIFKPSGMTSSTITDGPHPQSGVAHSYDKIAGQWKEDDYGEEPTFAAAGNGGVWSSARELALYEKAIRNRIFLPEEVLADARTAKNQFPVKELASIESQTWHLGWSWFVSERNGVKLVGHSGTQGGFYCNYISVPEKNVLFVMLANFPCDREKISTSIVDWIVQENYFEARE